MPSAGPPSPPHTETAIATPRTSPGFCRPESASVLIRALADAVTAGHPQAVVEQFTDGAVNWEVYLTRPGGGVLRTPTEVAEFVRKLHADRSRWRVVDVYPPDGEAELTEFRVYGVAVSIEDSSGTRTSPMKLVVDCARGGILRAAGPES